MSWSKHRVAAAQNLRTTPSSKKGPRYVDQGFAPSMGGRGGLDADRPIPSLLLL
jgi:hypothetical protein